MVNVADLYELFGEIAGLHVRDFVPKSRIVDSMSMLPYLINPSQAGLRPYNFTQTGDNISANGVRPGPCVISIPKVRPTCVQIFPQKAICETEGGAWWGPGATSPQESFNSCCELLESGKVQNMKVLPLSQVAVRNDNFKLIQVTSESCDPEERPIQLYKVNENTPVPRLDLPAFNLIIHQDDPTKGLTKEEADNYTALKDELDLIQNSERQCPGDGNDDGVVNQQDINNWTLFHKTGSTSTTSPTTPASSSWYDFPMTNGAFDPNGLYDGFTDMNDLKVIQANLGRTCSSR